MNGHTQGRFVKSSSRLQSPRYKGHPRWSLKRKQNCYTTSKTLYSFANNAMCPTIHWVFVTITIFRRCTKTVPKARRLHTIFVTPNSPNQQNGLRLCICNIFVFRAWLCCCKTEKTALRKRLQNRVNVHISYICLYLSVDRRQTQSALKFVLKQPPRVCLIFYTSAQHQRGF